MAVADLEQFQQLLNSFLSADNDARTQAEVNPDPRPRRPPHPSRFSNPTDSPTIGSPTTTFPIPNVSFPPPPSKSGRAPVHFRVSRAKIGAFGPARGASKMVPRAAPTEKEAPRAFCRQTTTRCAICHRAPIKIFGGPFSAFLEGGFGESRISGPRWDTGVGKRERGLIGSRERKSTLRVEWRIGG